MAIEIRVPALGESVTEAIVGQCYKKDGEIVKAGESLIELETCCYSRFFACFSH